MNLELDRRQVLAALGACGLGAVVGACSPGGGGRGTVRAAATSPVRPTSTAPASTGGPTGPTDPAAHLATRLTFGPTAAVLALAGRGVDAFLDDQLDPARPDGATADALLAEVDGIDRLLGAAPPGGGPEQLAARRRLAGGSLLLRTAVGAAWSDRQLHALLCDFWADHLHVAATGPTEVVAVAAYDREVVRPHALGPFRDLLVASARSRAMLRYLDQATSRADAGYVPNENYARELMELHTVGVDGGYDEADVRRAAHVMSGWSVAGPGGGFAFRPRRHDLGPAAGAEVLGFRPSGGGVADGEGFLDHLANLPATARYVCWRLAVRLVGDDVQPDDPVVAAAAAEFRANGTSVAAAVRSLVGSADFARSAPVARRPFDLVAAALRTACAPPRPDQLDDLGTRLGGVLRQLGQSPYGWPAPDGFPLRGDAWTTPGALVGRWNAATALATGFGVLGPAEGAGEGTAPEEVATVLLGRPPSAALRRGLDRLGRSADALAARAVTLASPDFGSR